MVFCLCRRGHNFGIRLFHRGLIFIHNIIGILQGGQRLMRGDFIRTYGHRDLHELIGFGK